MESGALIGEQAAEWFIHSRRGGGIALDAHVSAVQAIFGSDGYRLIVLPGSDIEGPATLLVEVSQPVDDMDAQAALDEVQDILLRQQEDLAATMNVRYPFARILVVLGGPPRDWNAIRAELEELE